MEESHTNEQNQMHDNTQQQSEPQQLDSLPSGTDSGNSWKNWFSNKFQHYKRVVKVTKKPSKDEFWTTVKVTGLGILLIGLIGFLILTLKIVGKGLLGV